MTFSHTALDFLLSDAGHAVLEWLAAQDLDESHTLILLDTLRRDHSPEDAGAALTLARLRRRAAVKFLHADRMFFTPDALEQASSDMISRVRAERFWAAGYTQIVDLGCGIGGDAVVLGGGPGGSVIARIWRSTASMCRTWSWRISPIRFLYAVSNSAVTGRRFLIRRAGWKLVVESGACFLCVTMCRRLT